MPNTELTNRGGIECRAEQFARQEFNSTQSSQLFINCCFALSFSGVFVIVAEALKTAPANALLIPLAIYLIFSIWRQYSVYYIPLQFYRNKPESDLEELITLIITLMLAAFCLVCVYLPHWTLFSLFTLIGLNLFKIRQMKQALKTAPGPANLATKELSTFSGKLWIYLIVAFLMMMCVWIYQPSLTGFSYYLVVGILPFLVQVFVRWIYGDFSGTREPAETAEKYIESIAQAWKSCDAQAEEAHG